MLIGSPRLPARRALRRPMSAAVTVRVGGGSGATLMASGMRHNVSEFSIGSVRAWGIWFNPRC